MNLLNKLKVAKQAAKMGIGGTFSKIDEIQKETQDQQKVFNQKQLELLGKFEDKLDLVIANQKFILAKLDQVRQEMD